MEVADYAEVPGAMSARQTSCYEGDLFGVCTALVVGVAAGLAVLLGAAVDQLTARLAQPACTAWCAPSTAALWSTPAPWPSKWKAAWSMP